ncbi:MAG: tetratricopeptide repeat protein [Sedimenticola sp.]
MGNRQHRFFIHLATVMTACWIGWSLYDMGWHHGTQETRTLSAGARYLEDSQYRDALQSFESVLERSPDHAGALMGKAQALMQLGAAEKKHRLSGQPGDGRPGDTPSAITRDYYAESLETFNRVIELVEREGATPADPTFTAVAYANRGILQDRMGKHRLALTDYRHALRIAPEVGEGPGFMTRFLRNQQRKPASIADRAEYLGEQLALPEHERVLHQADVDGRQRAYSL